MNLSDMLSNSFVKTPVDLRSRNEWDPKDKPGRIRFSPTRYGWLFVLVLLGLLMGSINYNNNLGFLFTFLLGSMILVSLVHSYRNVRGIAVDDIQARPVFETQDAIFEITLHPSLIQRISLRIRLGDNQETQTDMTPEYSTRVSVAAPARKRGRFSPGGLHMVSDYPFGLFVFQTSCQPGAECLVYPKPVPIQKLSMQDLLKAHSSEGVVLENVDDFKGLRTFQNGDATQHIFWKAFSKGQGLMVKEFMGHASPCLCFAWEKIKSENKEQKLSVLCGMVLKAHGMKLKYGIHLPGHLITPDKGEQHKRACLRALALF